MPTIIITPQVVGQAHLYELRGRQGRRTTVATYKAVVACTQTDRQFEIALTRDSSLVVFGKQLDRFGYGGECPPHRAKEPYRGRIREDGKLGFCVQLFEPGCQHQESLLGQGNVERRHICIHHGPAASEGCFTVAGGRRAYNRFVRQIKNLLGDSNPEIQVYVQKRL